MAQVGRAHKNVSHMSEPIKKVTDVQVAGSSGSNMYKWPGQVGQTCTSDRVKWVKHVQVGQHVHVDQVGQRSTRGSVMYTVINLSGQRCTSGLKMYTWVKDGRVRGWHNRRALNSRVKDPWFKPRPCQEHKKTL